MKKQVLIFLIFLSTILTAMGQDPLGFNYQAVIRDADGLVLNNQEVGMQISIIQGEVTGDVTYSETFSAETNNHGIVNLVIGSGNVQSGIFGEIDWSLGDYYIKIEVDVAGGINYTEMGTTQLLSVPYAHYAFSGNAGKSAYEIWLDLGNTGTVDDFIASLSGPDGVDGEDGLSAYEIWLDLGNTGTVDDFIASLTGPNGESAYEVWLNLGNTGTEQDFIDDLTGDSGTSSWNDEETAVHTSKNVGIGTSTPTAPLQVESTTPKGKGEPIFEVKNSTGKTVFAVYENDVKVFLETDETTGTPGEFAVKRRTTDTQIDDVFVANTEETKVYVDTTSTGTKETRGGFAISGRTSGKTALDYFKVTPGLTEIFVDEATAAKETRGGFAISGRTSGKVISDIFHVTNEFTRIYVDEPTAKETRGGFAISGRTSGKAEQEFFKITPSLTEFFVDETTTAKETRGGFAISGRTSGKTTSEIFRLTNDYTRFYVDETTTTKETRGGFAISGRTSGKAEGQDILKVTPGLTEVFVEETTGGKETRGGFAISGRTSGKADGIFDVLTVQPHKTDIFIKPDPLSKTFPDGFSILGLSDLYESTPLFTVSDSGTFVNTTLATPPKLAPTVLADTTQTTALFNGTVIDSGGSAIATIGVVYNISGPLNINMSVMNPAEAGVVLAPDGGSATFTNLPAENLRPGTTYNVRSFATNEDGITGYGPITTFVTSAPYTFTFVVADASEFPVSDAVITLVSATNPLDSIVNPVGVYTFDVAATTYNYHIDAPGFAPATGTIIVTGDGQGTTVYLSVATGKVTFHTTNSIDDPISDLDVYCTHTQFSNGGYTDPEGNLTLDLEIGTWNYTISDYFHNLYEEYNSTISVSEGMDTIVNVTMSDLPTYTYSFTVLDGSNNNEPLSGVDVHLYYGAKENKNIYDQIVATDANGVATFVDVPQNFYQVSIGAYNYNDGVDIASDGNLDIIVNAKQKKQ